MTISREDMIIRTVADGIVTAYTYDYRVDLDSHIETYFDDILQQPDIFTVDRNEGNMGGTVNFIVAPTSGVIVAIARVLPLTQETDYNPYDPFPAESHEKALDWITMMLQQHDEAIRITGLGDEDKEGDWIRDGNIWAREFPEGRASYGFGIMDFGGIWKATLTYDATIGKLVLTHHEGQGDIQSQIIIGNGDVTSTGNYWVKEFPDGDTFWGYGMLDFNDVWKATMGYDETINSLVLTHHEGEGDIQSQLIIGNGVLTSKGDFWVHEYPDGNPDYGYGIMNFNGDWKGTLTHNETTDSFDLAQHTDVNNIRTRLSLRDGQAALTGPGDAVIDPTLPEHLTTKKYVDSISGGSGYLPLTGGELTGTLTVAEEVKIKGAGAGGFAGYTIYDGVIFKGAIDWYEPDDAIEIWQIGADGSTADTRFALKNGKLSVSSESGLSTLPIENFHLTTKEYVDSLFMDNVRLVSTDNTAGHQVGITFADINNVAKGAVYYEVGSGDLKFSQGADTDAGGAQVSTFMTMSSGLMLVESFDGSDQTPWNDFHLTNKRYVDTFLPLVGGVVTGNLSIAGDQITVKDDLQVWQYGSEPTVGVTMRDAAGDIRGSMYWDSPNNDVKLLQETSVGVIATQVTLLDGKVRVESPAGSTTAPAVGNDLTNKTYVDAGDAVVFAAIGGLKSEINSLKTLVASLQATVASLTP